MVLSAVQTAESKVDVYIRKILDKQTDVDACTRLMDAGCIFYTSMALALNDWCILAVLENLSDRTQLVQHYVQEVHQGVQEVQLSLDASAISNVHNWSMSPENWLASHTDDQHLNDEVQRLKFILSRLGEPVVRSATQLSDLHDSLKRE